MENEPYIVVYRSKPIMGIQLELIGKNPNFDFNKTSDSCISACESLIKFGEALKKSSIPVITAMSNVYYEWGKYEKR